MPNSGPFQDKDAVLREKYAEREHTHPPSDISGLTTNLTMLRNEVETLKKAVIALVFIVCALAMLMLVFLG